MNSEIIKIFGDYTSKELRDLLSYIQLIQDDLNLGLNKTFTNDSSLTSLNAYEKTLRLSGALKIVTLMKCDIVQLYESELMMEEENHVKGL